jgi:hypothetical protein
VVATNAWDYDRAGRVTKQYLDGKVVAIPTYNTPGVIYVEACGGTFANPEPKVARGAEVGGRHHLPAPGPVDIGPR